MTSSVWVDGALVPSDGAHVSAFDHGILVGDGVFETLGVYQGVPFAWGRHDARLRRSADGLGPRRPGRRPAAGGGRRGAAGEPDPRKAGCGSRWTGGPVTPRDRSMGRRARDADRRGGSGSGRARRRGGRGRAVAAPQAERGATAGLKTISYAENVRALAFASTPRERHQGDVRQHPGRALRGRPARSVFVVADGVLCTPPESSGCLLGVTRALVLELGASVGVPLEERDLPISAHAGAEEAFLTSSLGVR